MDLFNRIFGQPVETISPAEAQKRMSQKDRPLILDVRQPEEYRAGHIAGAKLIPLNELPGRISELPKGRDIVCVCASGSRSVSATRKLVSAGYPALNLRGGMMAWSRAGLPVTKAKG